VILLEPLAIDENCNTEDAAIAAVVGADKVIVIAPPTAATATLEIVVPAAIPVPET
jgi:hypothetical protein